MRDIVSRPELMRGYVPGKTARIAVGGRFVNPPEPVVSPEQLIALTLVVLISLLAIRRTFI
jgi:hypothetical protein